MNFTRESKINSLLGRTDETRMRNIEIMRQVIAGKQLPDLSHQYALGETQIRRVVKKLFDFMIIQAQEHNIEIPYPAWQYPHLYSHRYRVKIFVANLVKLDDVIREKSFTTKMLEHIVQYYHEEEVPEIKRGMSTRTRVATTVENF